MTVDNEMTREKHELTFEAFAVHLYSCVIGEEGMWWVNQTPEEKERRIREIHLKYEQWCDAELKKAANTKKSDIFKWVFCAGINHQIPFIHNIKNISRG